MERWLKRNLGYIAIILFALFLIKNTQSCNRKMAIRTLEKNMSADCDSLLRVKDGIHYQDLRVIDSLEKENFTKDYLILDLTNELKIAGVKVDAADRRADAVQRTAEKIRTNTTIEIKGAEQVPDSIQNKE